MKDKIISLVYYSGMLICSVLSLCFDENLDLVQTILFYGMAISTTFFIGFWVLDLRKFNKLRDEISYDLKTIEKAEENHFLTDEEEQEFYIYRQNFERIVKSSDISNLEQFRDGIKKRFNRFLVSEIQ